MFNLSRYFSTISLALITLAGGVLVFFYYQLSVAQLVHMAQERNVAMAHIFHNTLWSHHRAPAGQGLASSGEALHLLAPTAQWHRNVLSAMRGTEVIKAKVYNPAGLTVYSSDGRQIGENKFDNPGFRSALAGLPLSEMTHRNQIDSFEGVLSDRDVISSYIPVRDEQGRVFSVFELYQDVTPFLLHLRQTLWWIAGGALFIFALLYLAQSVVVHHAQAILRRQEAELQDANSLLDERVQERTRELQVAQERLELRTHYDALTGLPNWFQFNKQLDHRLAHAVRHGEKVGVLFIDLDQFRSVNDSLGHSVGDALLKAVTARLNKTMRAEDTLARMGGDEFICMAEALREPVDAATVAKKLLKNFEQPFVVEGNELLVSASIGVSVFPDDGRTAEVLVRNADTAMYRAKESGPNSWAFYVPEMTQHASERLRMHRLLGGAIERQEFSLVYQPQVNTTTGELLGAEVLLRWHNPELGDVHPAQFIPLAEDTGLIVALGEWVLDTACRQLAQWDAQGRHLPCVSVNLSVRQLVRSDVLALVSTKLRQHGLAAHRLELEITESTLMAMERSQDLLSRLNEQGVRLSVDDFGTGYSSLSYIKLLPIHRLKIDRAFVEGIGHEGGDEAIIRTIISMAHSLKLEVVAEGVETQAQAAFLAQAGCPCVQGYAFGRPETPEQFALRLA